MNEAQREAIGNRLHIAVTLLALWLVTTSPWVSMLRRVPASAGFFDYAHMVLGVVALVRRHFLWPSSSCAAGAGDSTFPWPRAMARQSAVI